MCLPNRNGDGAAGLLMKEIITWSKDEHLDRLLLHASDEGRSVYERLGFIAGNEMRLVGVSRFVRSTMLNRQLPSHARPF